jgi:hypothetical protein
MRRKIRETNECVTLATGHCNANAILTLSLQSATPLQGSKIGPHFASCVGGRCTSLIEFLGIAAASACPNGA